MDLGFLLDQEATYLGHKTTHLNLDQVEFGLDQRRLNLSFVKTNCRGGIFHEIKYWLNLTRLKNILNARVATVFYFILKRKGKITINPFRVTGSGVGYAKGRY